MRMFLKSRDVKRILTALLTAASVGVANVSDAAQQDEGMGTNTQERVLTELARMMTKTLQPVTDDTARKVREENYVFVSNLLYQCEIYREFTRLEDGTPLLIDCIAGCDGAYKEIPCQVAIDDKYAHGSAVFPEANSGNTNMVEFVDLANRMVKTGHFEYDAEFGLVMYKLSMPVSAIRSKGRTTLGMIYGFPVMEVDLFSEAYKAVLDGQKTPKEAIAQVRQKLKKIEEKEPETGHGKPSEEAVGAIRKYFEDKGFPARPVKVGDRLGFRGTITSCLSAGMKNDGYDFRLLVDDEWVCSHVWLPNVVSNHQSEVQGFVARMNKQIEESNFTLVYNDKDGSVSCRSEVHVVEFTKDVPDSMFTLLRGPVEILDRCAVVIQKIGCGKIDAVGAMKEVRESSKDKNDSETKKTPTPKAD